MAFKAKECPTIFVGYDDSELEAFAVCRGSIKRKTPLSLVFSIEHRSIRKNGLFDRPWKVEKDGTFLDTRDGRPFSTQFAHSRFLTPVLANRLNLSDDLIIFCDCDFVWLESPEELLKEIRAKKDFKEKAVWVVKHDFKPGGVPKMINQSQVNYQKKLWSSLMVFNMDFFNDKKKADGGSSLPFSYSNDSLINTILINTVNNQSGQFLHSFEWLKSEDLIGSIDERWNFIPNHSEPRVFINQIGAIHFTHGLPSQGVFSPYDPYWWSEYDKLKGRDFLL